MAERPFLSFRRRSDTYRIFINIFMRPFLRSIPSISEDRMDLAYIALAVAFWLLVAGMAVGCAKLGGPKQ